jgi:acetyl esterase/lipase
VKQIAKQHWRLIADLADATGCPVDVPIYGLAPQHDLAEMVDFVVAVVCGLDGARVRLAGDSAGGGLALLVAQRLRDAGGSPVSSVTVMAPWLDLAMDNPDIDLIEPVDPWLARPAIRPMARAVAGTLRLDDPRVSPVRGSSGNLPPVTVLVGTRDMTLADVRLLRERVLAAGGSIVVHESPGSPHVHPLLPTPEGRAARRVFLDAVVAGG